MDLLRSDRLRSCYCPWVAKDMALDLSNHAPPRPLFLQPIHFLYEREHLESFAPLYQFEREFWDIVAVPGVKRKHRHRQGIQVQQEPYWPKTRTTFKARKKPKGDAVYRPSIGGAPTWQHDGQVAKPHITMPLPRIIVGCWSFTQGQDKLYSSS